MGITGSRRLTRPDRPASTPVHSQRLSARMPWGGGWAERKPARLPYRDKCSRPCANVAPSSSPALAPLYRWAN